MKWTYIFVVCLFCIGVEGGGKLWLKLVNFSNSRGKGANGHYCDGKFFIRGSDCDHRFIICLDTENGPQNTNVCAYGYTRTATTFDTNHITFGSMLGGHSNPMIYSFNKWSGSCKLKIDVYDDDDNADDYVDFIYGYYYNHLPGYNESTTQATPLTLQYRVIMNVQLKVYCDPGYYGTGCDVYCWPSDKYTCNIYTGTKICSKDWTGPDCNVKKDACLSEPCKNNATCHNSLGSYLCVCQEGYTGVQCEEEVDECASFPCKNNGTCIDLQNSYHCICLNGYSNHDCSLVINLCLNNPCLNNGTCKMIKDNHGFNCECSTGWAGEKCGLDVDECSRGVCLNGATCENKFGTFECRCSDGWIGDECQTDIDECSSVNCFGNSTCINTNGSFVCSCQHGYTGKLCNINIDECSSSPCLNGAICHDEVNGFRCDCSNGYSGILCQEEIDACAGETSEISIYLDGDITNKDKDIIVSSIKQAVNKYGGYDVGTIDLNETVYLLIQVTGRIVTNMTFSLLVNGTQLCGKDLEILKGLLKKEKTLKLYHGDVANLQNAEAVVEQPNTFQKIWFKDNWYILILAVAVVVAISATVFVIVRYKRKRVVLSGSHNNNSIAWHFRNGTDTLPSLAFDNDLYQTVQQGEQTTFRQIASNSVNSLQAQTPSCSSALENNLYQNTLPEEQTKLMALYVDRFDELQ